MAVCAEVAVGAALAVEDAVADAELGPEIDPEPLLAAVALFVVVAAPVAAPLTLPAGEGKAAVEGEVAMLALPVALMEELTVALPVALSDGVEEKDGEAGHCTRRRTWLYVSATITSPLGSTARPLGEFSRAAAPTPLVLAHVEGIPARSCTKPLAFTKLRVHRVASTMYQPPPGAKAT